MTEQLITFETARLAKRVGFSTKVQKYYTVIRGNTPNKTLGGIYNLGEVCSSPRIGYITDKYNYNSIEDYNYEGSDQEYVSAPTQSLLQKWLRETHNIHIKIEISNIGRYYFQIYQFEPKNKSNVLFFISQNVGLSKYDVYEEALEIGLQEALKLIK